MNKKQVERIRVEILERRNYLKGMEAPLKYSKRSLYGGQQERVRRQEDKAFRERAIEQNKMLEKELIKVDKYLIKLDSYNVSKKGQRGPMNMQTMDGQQASQVTAPAPLQFIMPKMIKMNKADKVRSRVRSTRIGGRY